MGLSLLRFGNRRSSRPFCGLSSYLPRAQLQAAQGLQWFHQEKFWLVGFLWLVGWVLVLFVCLFFDPLSLHALLTPSSPPQSLTKASSHLGCLTLRISHVRAKPKMS